MPNHTTDQIREHVRLHYLEPARRSRQARFSVRCGNIQKELGISNRIAQVCNALKIAKFLEPNGLRLVETSGPPSGTSTTVVYTYEFLDAAPAAATPAAPLSSSIFERLLQMEGILKDVYKELGGAERAIREEREGYSR
ncbi:MAG TPA: hypothetical protein VGR73_16145 [Bryobacteraceae bacterium]|nr:hypothetical protein [Bryobacteraceae bacterium]